MATDPAVIDKLRDLATAAGVDVTDAQLNRVAPAVVAMLSAPDPGPRNLGETEPLFGVRFTKG